MKGTGMIGGIAVAAALTTAVWQWRTATRLRAENDALQAQLETTQIARTAVSDETPARGAELQKLRSEVQELVRLRGEVTRLRLANKETEQLRAENKRLQQLSNAAPTPGAPPATPAVAEPANHFPRESWTFAGYATPEAALVSAIWSMQQGNPNQYFESLTPEEQARIAKTWEGKSQEEIATKHKNDTSQITGFRILRSDGGLDDEAVVSVFIEGVNREDKVRMQRVGEQWKFGGFVREARK